MAYTIRPARPDRDQTMNLARALLQRVRSDGRFSCRLEDGKKLGDIVVREVRLTTAKPNCGQHAGPCDLPRFGGEKPHKNLRFLQWFDWIDFNGLVNDVLDELGVEADVWSTPQDTRVDAGRKLWIRRGTRRRVHWDVEEQLIGGGPWTEYVADHGSESQFTMEG